MLSYRLYFLNNEGHIVRASELSAETDQQAIYQAQQASNGAPTELWEGARCILPWPAASSREPPDVAEASQQSSAVSP
jgi:hypothetical protein